MKYIILALILSFSTPLFAQERACHALFEHTRPTEEQIDLAIHELYGLRSHIYKESSSMNEFIKKEFAQKFNELSQYLTPSEIKNRMKLVKPPAESEQKIQKQSDIDNIIKHQEEVIKLISQYGLKDFKSYTNPINVGNNGFKLYTALGIAFALKKFHLIEEMILLGADVNSSNLNVDSPLMHAISARHLESIKILVKYGADIHYIMRDGMNYLFYTYIYKRSPEVIEYFLEQGIDPNQKWDTNITPLHLAAKNGELQIVKLLLKYKADVNAKDNKGKTALGRVPTTPEYKEIIDLLKAHGATK